MRVEGLLRIMVRGEQRKALDIHTRRGGQPVQVRTR